MGLRALFRLESSGLIAVQRSQLVGGEKCSESPIDCFIPLAFAEKDAVARAHAAFSFGERADVAACAWFTTVPDTSPHAPSTCSVDDSSHLSRHCRRWY